MGCKDHCKDWYKNWYKTTAMLLDENNNYSTYKCECKGKGEFTSYKAFDGIEIVFADFDSPDTFIPEVPHEDIIEVSWCRRGRVECEFENNTVAYLQEGDFGIDATSFIPVSYEFPLGIYEAVTLIINKKEFSEETRRTMKLFSVDLDQLCNTLGLDKQWYICKANVQLQHLFDEIYQAREVENKSYFSIKALELLYYVQFLTEINGCEVKYYTKNQIQNVKNIKDYLISHLDKKIKIEEYVSSEKMGLTTFRAIFLQIYGDTPTVYLKKYKMLLASKMLRDKSLTITSIALNLGYNNPSKFAKAFKEIYGMLPKDYKKSVNNENKDFYKKLIEE